MDTEIITVPTYSYYKTSYKTLDLLITIHHFGVDSKNEFFVTYCDIRVFEHQYRQYIIPRIRNKLRRMTVSTIYVIFIVN